MANDELASKARATLDALARRELLWGRLSANLVCKITSLLVSDQAVLPSANLPITSLGQYVSRTPPTGSFVGQQKGRHCWHKSGNRS